MLVAVPMFAALVLGATQPAPIVAVFDINNRGAPMKADTAHRLSEYVATLLAANDGYRIVPRGEVMRAIQREKAESYRECYDESCQIEIGKEVAATHTLATDVSKLGTSCIVSMRLFDLRSAASARASTARGSCDDDAIVGLVEQAAAQLSGTRVATPQPTSTIVGPSPVRIPPPVPKPAATPRTITVVATDQLLGPRSTKWGNKEQHAAALLKKLMRRTKKRDPGMMRRLGLLYAQDRSNAKNRKMAIRIFEQLIRMSPTYEGLDEAYLEMGWLLYVDGNPDGAMSAWTNLVRQYPKSGFAPSAYFGIAEVLFDRADYAKAAKVYRRSFPNARHPTIAAIGQYKLALCHNLLGDPRDSVLVLDALLADSPPDAVAVAARDARSQF